MVFLEPFVWPFLLRVFIFCLSLNRSRGRDVASIYARISLSLVPKALFLDSIGWNVETDFLNVFNSVSTYLVHYSSSFDWINICLFLSYSFISKVLYLWICCESSTWKLSVTFFVAYNSGHLCVRYADVVLNGNNYTWYFVGFTRVFSAEIFWPSHI